VDVNYSEVMRGKQYEINLAHGEAQKQPRLI